MAAKSERPRNRRIRLVGGGFRWTREVNAKSSGGSMKAQRRRIRKAEKAKKGHRRSARG